MGVSYRERHVRWNWEKSDDNDYGGNPMVRYHLVIVGDRFRESIEGKFLGELSNFMPGFEEVRRKEGKVVGTDFRYLFVSYDSPVSPKGIRWSRVSPRVKKDNDLRERKSGSEGIEEYVESIYGRG